ncbi:MAG: DUF1801 domain-containing protein [Flavihumibacter sp.]
MASHPDQTADAYLQALSPDIQAPVKKLRKLIKQNLPKGFAETMQYGMIAYVVPHSLYPKGYQTDPAICLPFISLAAQKNHIAVYHMAVYDDPVLKKWFAEAFAKTGWKLDMGKSCIRFKNPDKIPFELMGELATKITVQEWIARYEKSLAKK